MNSERHSRRSCQRYSSFDQRSSSLRTDGKPPSLLGRLSSLTHSPSSDSRRSTVSFSADASKLDTVSMYSDVAESEEKESTSPWDLIVNLDESDLRTREEYHLSQKQIMLLNFINGAEERVAVWRPPANKTSKDLNKMPLAIRAAFIEDMVASRFCKWLRGLGGRTPNLDEKSLKELFQIGIVNPTSASIRTICEERTFIPDLVAEKLNLPEKTLLNQLQRQLQWDVAAEARPEKTIAFGKFLEPADQFRPPKNRTQETWFACDSIPKDMEQYTEQTHSIIMDSRDSSTNTFAS